ncbi:hypothetical protein KKH36_04100 [Patescibacteria group bacterium]|nr:hypothetical protein [Patescibacteria group bacterium]
MKVILTICSKNKDKNEVLMPARKRYLSDRIKKVEQISINNKLPFYILSGKFGIINSNELIPFYDKLLKQEDIKNLLPLVRDQLIQEKITEIIFYGEGINTKGWKAYYEIIEKITNKLNIKLEEIIIK